MKRQLFLLFSALVAAIFLAVVWKDFATEWRGVQSRFFAQTRKNEGYQIRQVMLDELRRVDRCTTCHLAIDRPSAAQAAQPFTAHPGEYLKWHPVEQFGCTVCHQGQGLATTTPAAHGEVKHWERPLLEGPMLQASCGRCHGDLARIERHVPQLMRGRQLFQERGCVGCHAIAGKGQTVSVDLADIGAMPLARLDWTFVQGPHTLANYLYEHFKDPQRIIPGFPEQHVPPSAMPNYQLTDEDAMALTVYMMSLTGEHYPSNYVTPAPPEQPVDVNRFPSRVAAGREVYVRYGCGGCHGVNAEGGRRNWNRAGNQEIPALIYTQAGFTREQVKDLIRRGVLLEEKENPQGPVPPLYMPAWKDRISGEELDVLVDYLFSLAPPDATPPSEPAAPAASTNTAS